MNSFERYSDSLLYGSSEQQTDGNYFAYYMPESNDPPGSISYKDSWSEYTGIYLFLSGKPSDEKMNAFISVLGEAFPAGCVDYTSVAWLIFDEKSGTITTNILLKTGIKTEDKTTVLASHFELEILKAVLLLAKESNVITRTDADGNPDGLIVEYPLSMENAPLPVPLKNVIIPLTGQQRGCLTGEVAFEESGGSSPEMPDRGIYFFITKPDKPEEYLGQYYPLFSKESSKDAGAVYAGYQMTFDPLDPYNPLRTNFICLGFAYSIVEIEDPPYKQIELLQGSGYAQTSYFTTVFGDPVKLSPVAGGPHPAGFVLCPLPPGSAGSYYMAPRGDFEVINDSEEELPLACGLSGTEFFNVRSEKEENTKTVIRFKDNEPACVEKFPFELASPVGSPVNPADSPFTDNYKTSWFTLIQSDKKSISYISQPKGAALYGKSAAYPVDAGLLGHVSNPLQFTSDENDFFPLVPYGGLVQETNQESMSDEDMQMLETIVLSKQRHASISKQTPSGEVLLSYLSDTDSKHFATTPAGLLVTTTQNKEGAVLKWDQFLLAKNGTYELAFNDPGDQVISAMQASNIFMVASDSTCLQGFSGTMGIGDWELDAEIGLDQQYGDYSNVMIFKGRKGKLYDPDDAANCLVANPKKWNQTEDFSIPQTGGKKDPAQLIILSNWLQDYFKNAYEQESDYFSKFNAMAVDENWTGVLFLRVNIKGMPGNLSGIMAGVTNPEAFNAHHLGVEVSPVQLTGEGLPDLSKPSSLFGLIYYLDPDFSDVQPVKSIAPSGGGLYDFRLLSLKVLFENTAVKSFESYAQLTLNQLFGSSITKTRDKDNIYKNVLLAGSLQITNGQHIYSLSSQKDDAFYLQSNIINKVEITDASLSNRSLEGAAEQKSWFGLRGFIDFNILKGDDGETYDLLSFGNNEGEDALRKGLSFSNLGIAMNYPKEEPSNSTLSFAADEIRFNLSPDMSTPREGSLFLQLALSLENMVAGKEGETPKDKGYLDVISGIRLTGSGAQGWYALRFKLNMGTPGALAENAGLNSYILVSWSPDSTGENDYRAGMGISLPGSGGSGKLLSLQSVLKLSIGQILLHRVPAASGDQKTFMLMFTEIALKFLGLLKIPPGGNTLFYLFGNPKAEGDASALGWYAMYKKDAPPKSGAQKQTLLNINP